MPKNLPGEVPVGTVLPPLPALPGTQPHGPTAPVPAFWADAGRIAADMLELYSTDPETAKTLWDFARAKLAEIRAEQNK